MNREELIAHHTTGITDGLGLTLDPGIAPLVGLLIAAGVDTLASCEGHENWGLPYPWVDIHGNSYNYVNERLRECFAGAYCPLTLWKFDGELVDGELVEHDRQFRLMPVDELDVPGARVAMQRLAALMERRLRACGILTE